MAKHRAPEVPEDEVVTVEDSGTTELDKAAAIPVVVEAAQAVVAETSVWQKNRTTIANVVGVIVNMIVLAAAIPNESLSPLATAYIAIVVQGIAALVGLVIPDAISKNQAQTVVNKVDTAHTNDE